MVELTFASFAVTLFIAIVFGVAYAAMNYLTAVAKDKFNWGRFAASVIFGIFIGVYTVYSGGTIETINWTVISATFFAFQGVLLWVNSIMDWIWFKATGQKVLEKTFQPK